MSPHSNTVASSAGSGLTARSRATPQVLPKSSTPPRAAQAPALTNPRDRHVVDPTDLWRDRLAGPALPQLRKIADVRAARCPGDLHPRLSPPRLSSQLRRRKDAEDTAKRFLCARASPRDELGNYDAASEDFRSPRLRKSLEVRPPTSSIDLSAVCPLYMLPRTPT